MRNLRHGIRATGGRNSSPPSTISEEPVIWASAQLRHSVTGMSSTWPCNTHPTSASRPASDRAACLVLLVPMIYDDAALRIRVPYLEHDGRTTG